MKVYLKHIFISLLIAMVFAIGFIYSGIYPIGVDNKHNALTFWVLETLRTKSIARAAKDIDVPPLQDSQLLLSGGADYNDMCAGCHLTPGQTDNDMTVFKVESEKDKIVDHLLKGIKIKDIQNRILLESLVEDFLKILRMRCFLYLLFCPS